MVTRTAPLIWLLALVFVLCPRLMAKPLADFKVGDTLDEDIVTPVRLVVIDAAATQALRDKEAQKVPVFFGYDSNAANQVEAVFLSAFSDTRRAFLDELDQFFKRRAPDAASVRAPAFHQFVASFQQKHKEFPLTTNLAAQWASGEPATAILAEWERVLRKMMSYYILPDDVPPDLELGAQVRILQRPTSVFPANMETVHQAGRLLRKSNLYTLSRARRELPGVFEAEAGAAATCLVGFLRPNCVLEAELTRQLRVKRAASILATDRYDAGQKIASRGQRIDATTMAALGQLREKLALIQAQQRLVEERSQAAAENQRRAWVLAGAPALLLGLGFVAWRLAGRRQMKTLLPVSVRTAAAPAASEAAQPGVRAGLVTQLAQLMADKLVQRLVSDRRVLLEAQQKAAQEVAELEARLQRIHAPLQDRLEAYEQRIAELEKELANKDEQNRVLIETKILLVRKQSEIERAKTSLHRN